MILQGPYLECLNFLLLHGANPNARPAFVLRLFTIHTHRMVLFKCNKKCFITSMSTVCIFFIHIDFFIFLFSAKTFCWKLYFHPKKVNHRLSRRGCRYYIKSILEFWVLPIIGSLEVAELTKIMAPL